jgi:hypothetical protein
MIIVPTVELLLYDKAVLVTNTTMHIIAVVASILVMLFE